MTDFNIDGLFREVVPASVALLRLLDETTEPAAASDGTVILNDRGREMATLIAKDLEKDGPEAYIVDSVYAHWMSMFNSLPKLTAILREALTLARNPHPEIKPNIRMNLGNMHIDPRILGFAD